MNCTAAFRQTLFLGLVVFLLHPVAAPAAEPDRSRPLQLSLDATEAPRHLLHARLSIPAAPGPLTLCYPKWIPGEHAASGPVADLSGLKLRAAGKPLAWQRDDVDLYALHCTVPAGADAVEAALDYLAPVDKVGSATARLAVLNWNLVVLYPEGRPVRDVSVRANLTLPAGWKLGTALPVEVTCESLTQFATVSLETLVDSPVLCGAHLKEVALGPAHSLVVACDSAAGLDVSDDLKQQHERLIAEAGALFGARHYRSYRFLLTLSDQLHADGLEHHESSDNRLPERFLIDDNYRKQSHAWLLAHEYVHSWNGKYRRPAGMATPDYQRPVQTRMLWVYEGLTEYLGFVLAGRSGLWTPELCRAHLADVADWAGNQRGRTWRSLEDVCVSAPFLYSAREDWSRRRRGVDFYNEGLLLWLDVDTLLRGKTSGKKSLDDFCRAFFGGSDGPPEVRPYTFDDLVRGLDGVAPYDWKGFLEKRVTATGPEPPLDGVARGGWKVTYQEEPGEVLQAGQEEDKGLDLTASLGVLLKEDGSVTDVVPGKAADRAGLGPGMKLVAVNGRRWSPDRLKDAVKATRTGGKLHLQAENGDFSQTFALDYTDGARYPHLERDASKPDLLADILKPRTRKEGG
jgi:predicted metalloprotease with PDZ domain